jgi:micrococcal nuclease
MPRLVSALVIALLVAPDPHQHYPVTFAVDGDTLQIAAVGRVRLLGIDAPELAYGFDTAAPFARQARDRLAALVVGRYVRLETDGDARDRYGRVLAYVIRDDGVLVNAEMLRAGLARVTARQPLRRLDELRRAEREAQAARRGMWVGLPGLPGLPG